MVLLLCLCPSSSGKAALEILYQVFGLSLSAGFAIAYTVFPGGMLHDLAVEIGYVTNNFAVNH